MNCFGDMYIKLQWQYKAINIDKVGKTVFLTKEGAEQALKEREQI